MFELPNLSVKPNAAPKYPDFYNKNSILNPKEKDPTTLAHNVMRETWNTDPGQTMQNRFDKYDTPFNYEDMSKILDTIDQMNRTKINNSSNRAGFTAKKAAAGRLKSQGMKGGSYFNDQFSDIDNTVNKDRTDALTTLASNRIAAEPGLMQLENENTFQNTAAAQDIDIKKAMMALQRLGLLQGASSNFNNISLQQESKPGTWDDILGFLNTASNVGKSVAAFL